MIVLVNGNKNSIDLVRQDAPKLELGQLVTPLCHHGSVQGARFAIDNGAYNRFDADKFRRVLAREKPNRGRCIFVAAPDVVGSARRTLEVFSHWYPKLAGWPVALVCQDGQEDLDIPWRLIAGVFIGGSTEWKLSVAAEQIVRAAQAIGKWVHVGRVNTPQRIDKFYEMGVDSIDGASFARHGNGYSRDRKKCVTLLAHPRLAFDGSTLPASDVAPTREGER